MKRFLLVILPFIFSNTLFAQKISGRVQKEVSSLKASAVDTFLIYSISCSGGMPSIDSCGSEQTQYLFWKSKGFYFLKRFDYCQSFKKIALHTSNPFSFYLLYKAIIDTETIKPPTYIESKKGNPSKEVVMTVDHDCKHQITVLIKNQTKVKNVSFFALHFYKFSNGKRNIYYTTNSHTKLKSLIDYLSKTFSVFENSGKFVSE